METCKADMGVLLNHSQLVRALENRYGFEYLPYYAKAAEKADVTVIFFSEYSFLKKADFLYAFQWDPDAQTFRANLYSPPSVIHNRALLPKSKMNQIHSILNREETIVHNGLMRFDKYKVYQLLSSNPLTATYLPKTEELKSNEQIKKWLNQFETVYLKPRSGSLGMGVIRFRQLGRDVEISRTRKGHSCHERIPSDKISRIRYQVQQAPYIIQEGICLIKIEGKPIDFRISVQKGATGDWSISGIVAKMGTYDAHVTNLAAGGTAVAAREVLDTVYGYSKAKPLYKNLQEAALMIAHQLEGIGPNISDLGLDVTLTRDGMVKFIEANGRDLRITFRDADQIKMWKNTFQNPILYSAHLLKQQKNNLTL